MSQIPVSELFLFNHGMGFLVRSCKQKIFNQPTSQQVIFKIKGTVINDVLKSLLLNIPNCTVTDVNYTTPTKEENQLELERDDTLSSFIKDNKGLKVKLSTKEQKEPILGRLILVQGENELSHEPKAVSMMTDNGIQLIPVKNITSLQILDKKLINNLEKTLFNFTWDKDKEREVIISFKPEDSLEETNVTIGYLIQMPVWKISYRINILTDNNIQLLGWAIIENETNDDWDQISLKLISGNPVSFIYNQDDLIHLSRSDFTPLPPKASGPVIAQASIESEIAEEMDDEKSYRLYNSSIDTPKMSLFHRAPGSIPPPPTSGAPPPSVGWLGDVMAQNNEPEEYFDKEKSDHLMDQMIDAFQETDKEIKAGSDYYVFTITSKITIPSKEKSLIPLINEKITAKKILYHKNIIDNPSPYQAIEFTNNSKFPYESGPVMLFSKFPIGQAILEKTNVGQTRILTYALEDRMRIQYNDEDTDYSEFLYSFHPEMKLLIQRRFQYLNLELRIINFLQDSKKVIIDYFPKLEVEIIPESIPKDFKINKKDGFFRIAFTPLESSLEKYSIQFKKELVVNLKFESLDKKVVLNISPEIFGSTPELKEKLIHFIEIQERIKLINVSINKIHSKMNDIVNDENRIQKNLKSLSNNKEDDRTKNNFMIKLEELFDESLNLQRDEEELKTEQNQLQENLDMLTNELIQKKN